MQSAFRTAAYSGRHAALLRNVGGMTEGAWCVPAAFSRKCMRPRQHAFASRVLAASSGAFKLILYSKPDCHLCDGLKEKLEALLDRAQFAPSALSHADLEVRDITTNASWEEAYGLAIPVLTSAQSDGSDEHKIPRPAPRISADRLEQHIQKALEQHGRHPAETPA